METRASYFLVGLFVLSLIVGMFGFVVWLTRFELKDENIYYYVYFRGSVTGLSVGSTVRYRGVPIGTVTQIGIDSRECRTDRGHVGASRRARRSRPTRSPRWRFRASPA